MNTNTNAALINALNEAQAGLEFAAARMPQTCGFVPSHIAALKIVNEVLSTAAQPPAVVGERFQRAWLRLDQLPGTMMVGPKGLFGPVPASCSAWVTTSEEERDRCRAKGETMTEVWLAAAPKATKAEPVQTERVPLTESQIVKCLADADCGGIVKTFYYSSRHERNRPSISVTRLVDAIERAHGIQPAQKEQPNG